jgi:hypothetical protein
LAEHRGGRSAVQAEVAHALNACGKTCQVQPLTTICRASQAQTVGHLASMLPDPRRRLPIAGERARCAALLASVFLVRGYHQRGRPERGRRAAFAISRTGLGQAPVSMKFLANSALTVPANDREPDLRPALGE